MAPLRNIYGWEVGAQYGASAFGTAGAADWISGSARSGCYYGRCNKTGDGFFYLSQGAVGPFVNTTIQSVSILRCAFQIQTPINAGVAGVMSIGSAPQAGTGAYTILQVNPSNNWRIVMRASHNSAFSGTVLTPGTWYVAEITFTLDQVWDGTSLTNTESVTCTCNGETLVAPPVISFGNFGTGFDRVYLGFLPFPAWYSFGATTTAGVFAYDDAMFIMGAGADVGAVIFPIPTRIRLMGVSGQGSQAQWTGNAADLTSVPVNVASPGQSSAVLGQVTLLAHPPAETAGVLSLGSVGTEVVKVYGYLTIPAGSPIENLRIGAAAYPVDVSVAVQAFSPVALQWQAPGNPLSSAQLNALEFGWENATGAAIRTPAIHAEILCELESWAEPGCGLYFPPGPVNPCTGARGAPNRGA